MSEIIHMTLMLILIIYMTLKLDEVLILLLWQREVLLPITHQSLPWFFHSVENSTLGSDFHVKTLLML